MSWITFDNQLILVVFHYQNQKLLSIGELRLTLSYYRTFTVPWEGEMIICKGVQHKHYVGEEEKNLILLRESLVIATQLQTNFGPLAFMGVKRDSSAVE